MNFDLSPMSRLNHPHPQRRGNSLELCRNKLKNGLIFFHVPKTAGRWFQNFALLAMGSQKFTYIYDHRSVRELCGANANYQTVKNEDHLVISIIRNPFDILVSMHRHRNEIGWGDEEGWWNCHWYGKSLREFLLNFPLNVASIPEPELLCTWYPYFSDNPNVKELFDIVNRGGFRRSLFHQTYRENGKSEADIFIRYENLAGALKLLFDENLIEDQISKILAPGRRTKEYQKYYDNNTRKTVERTYAWELESFGYSFDGVSDDRAVIFPWEVGRCPLDL